MVPNHQPDRNFVGKITAKVVPADPTSISWKAADHISSPTSMAIFHLSHCCSHSFGEIIGRVIHHDSPSTNGWITNGFYGQTRILWTNYQIFIGWMWKCENLWESSPFFARFSWCLFALHPSKQLPLVAAKKTGSNQMCYKQKDNHTTYAIGGFGFSDIIPFSFVWNWLIPLKNPCFHMVNFPMAGPMFKPPLSSSSSELSKEYSAAASRTSGGTPWHRGNPWAIQRTKLAPKQPKDSSCSRRISWRSKNLQKWFQKKRYPHHTWNFLQK